VNSEKLPILIRGSRYAVSSGSRRLTRRLSVAILLALSIGLAISAAPAMAVLDGHIYDHSWGSEGTEAGQFAFNYSGWDIAQDQSTGDIYMADSGNHRVQKFDEDGNFILMWGYGVKNGENEPQVCSAPETCQVGLAGVAPGQLENPSSIAVDNSNGPNQGRVYVEDPSCWCGEGRNLIMRFSPNGQWLGDINGDESPGGAFHALGGDNLAVDTGGFVWVADGERMMRFSNQPSNPYVGGSEWEVVWYPFYAGGNPVPGPSFNLAVNPDAGSVDLHSWYEGNCCGLYRFVANGSASRLIKPTSGGPLAFNEASGNLFIGNVAPTSNDCPMNQEYDDNQVEPQPIGPPFTWSGLNCGVASLVVDPSDNNVFALGGAAKIAVFKPRRVPESLTEPATEVHHTTAILNGKTAPDPVEGGPVSECVFEWGLSKSYENKTPCEPGTPIAAPTDVKLNLSGLIQEAIYHYRLTTKNSVDTAHGVDRTFTPHAVVETKTGTATEITPASATLHGSFDPDGLQTNYYFEWGRNEKLAETAELTPLQDGGSASGATSITQTLEGLEDYTIYYYRFVAENSLGTSYGAKQSFRTIPPEPPAITGSSANGVTDSSAHLSAGVKPNFGETIYGFEYGETPAYGEQTLGSDLLAADVQVHPVQIDLSGLAPGQTYHYRPLAINYGGISYGPDQSFTTLDAPTVLSETAAGITGSGARLTALVQPGLSPTTVHFEYGPTEAYGSSTPGTSIGGGAGAVSTDIDVNGLTPEATYHFRAVASNAIGTESGTDQSFKTGAQPHTEVAPKPKACQRGFVRRHGKCLKRHRPKRRPAANRRKAK
jgi:phosphodiesterase/alkaline phosphatase D-like protein